MFKILKKLLMAWLMLMTSYGACQGLEDKEEREREELLIQHVRNSIALGSMHISKLPNSVLEISGMSSPKVRHFLNNICTLPDANYLEIGMWMGSTWISALYENQETLNQKTAIDDWSLFGSPFAQFIANCARFLPDYKYDLFATNCFKVDIKSVFKQPVNIYFYDGDHSVLSQELAFTYFNDILDDLFIAIVDDWNFPEVPLGTKIAFYKLNYKILFEVTLPANHNADVDNWWNGLYVAVIRKPKGK